MRRVLYAVNGAHWAGGAPVLAVLNGGLMAKSRIANQTVLVMLPAADDRKSLTAIFARSHWKLRFARGRQEVRTALRAVPSVVISERELCDGRGWQDVLRELQKMEYPPPLIVADRLADDRLWAEVLNLGAHDLLAKPFHAGEVLHAVAAACRPFQNQQPSAAHRPPAKPPSNESAAGIKARRASAR